MSSKLPFVSLSIGTLLMLSITSVIAATQQTVYAQSNDNNIPKNCPSNTYSFARGYCYYEATPAPVTCEEGLELVDDMCRTIEPTRYHMAFCPTGYEVSYYTHPDYGFISSCTAIGSHPPYDEDEIADPTCDILYKDPDEIVVLENYESPVFRHDTICAFYEVKEPIQQGNPTCDYGGELINNNEN